MYGISTEPYFSQWKIFTIFQEGERAELIDGQIYMMAPPISASPRNNWFSYRKIADYIDRKERA